MVRNVANMVPTYEVYTAMLLFHLGLVLLLGIDIVNSIHFPFLSVCAEWPVGN